MRPLSVRPLRPRHRSRVARTLHRSQNVVVVDVVDVAQVATRNALRLDLTFGYFEHLPGPLGPVTTSTSRVPSVGFPPAPVTILGDRPPVEHCVLLLHWIESVIALAGRMETVVTQGPIPPTDFVARFRRLSEMSGREGRDGIRELRFSSPFYLQILLAIGSPPSLAVLIYGIKRSFGLDLEFKAYRERRGTEYETERARHIEAKRLADRLEAEPAWLPELPGAGAPPDVRSVGWEPQSAVLSGSGAPGSQDDFIYPTESGDS